jgi:hypothetical protein
MGGDLLDHEVAYAESKTVGDFFATSATAA